MENNMNLQESIRNDLNKINEDPATFDDVNQDRASQAEEISKMVDEDLDEIYEIVFGANGNANHTHGELVEVLRALMKGNPSIVNDVYNWSKEERIALTK
jgi:hypothetical protein